MEKYLKLILKKEQYIKRMRSHIDSLDQELQFIQREMQLVREQNEQDYICLHKLNNEEKEENKTISVFFVMVTLAVLSVLSYPFILYLGFSSLFTIMAILGFNTANIILSFASVKIIKKYYRYLREKNKKIIQEQFSKVMSSNKKREEVFQKYTSILDKKKDSQVLIEHEEQSIEKIKREIMDSLLAICERKKDASIPLFPQDLEMEFPELDLLDQDMDITKKR